MDAWVWGWGSTRWILLKPEPYKFMGSALKNFPFNSICILIDHFTTNFARARFFLQRKPHYQIYFFLSPLWKFPLCTDTTIAASRTSLFIIVYCPDKCRI